MTAIQPTAPAAAKPASASPGQREQLHEAAQRFEAIFVRQMLAAARKSEFGGDLLQSQGTDTFRQMQDENFADIASMTGAFGLASMIEAQLSRHLPQQER